MQKYCIANTFLIPIPTIRQTYPRLCPTLPKALGTCAQSNRLIVLMFSGINPHVRGHKLRTSLHHFLHHEGGLHQTHKCPSVH